MKKKIVVGFLLILFMIVISSFIFRYFTNSTNSQLLSNLQGAIYYIERVDGTLTLFKSDATLQNKTLIYSHEGKGKDSFGGYNDNVSDFYYDKTNNKLFFIAMNKGSWSLFSLKEGEKEPTWLQNVETEKEFIEIETDYIQDQYENRKVISKKGSLYLIENEKEKLIKKFYGLYSSKFTGYQPIGFSPDGKYLVYLSKEHLTPLGTILEDFIRGSSENMYIMDLTTMKSSKFVNSYNIQWVMD